MSQKFNTELSWLRFEKVLLKLKVENRQLKRENAMMKRTIKGLWVEHCTPNVCLRGSQWSEIHAKMPGLFAGGKKGK